MGKIKVSDLECFGEVSDVIGKAQAEIELFKVLSVAKECGFDDSESLSVAFLWDLTPQGCQFWDDIYDGINPYDN
ncbi:hypothetical protein VPHK165_0006 [Vibrio phage K165]|nr:hypothetical protein MYOV022v2_p0005 [Vibrio phage 12E28.1]QZI90174.1 hypothetical protein MYOV021v2_p0005 [Vibrio phage 18E29.1]QZI90619.1 hypothetical protein MYOV023v1_p0072 [Vibrio phage 91E28.1a]QZI90632.1 hypothetical protein MYOV020v1_p0006 [Vibrio phage 98E28.6a]